MPRDWASDEVSGHRMSKKRGELSRRMERDGNRGESRRSVLMDRNGMDYRYIQADVYILYRYVYALLSLSLSLRASVCMCLRRDKGNSAPLPRRRLPR